MQRKMVHQYEIVRKLGIGGAGVVYFANDTKLRRPVVLKMLHHGPASSEDARQSILREARLASAVDHPNVCAIYEVGEIDGEAYIVMQYVPGRTLDQVISGGPLALPLALSIAIQIADGLAEAHQHGILHGDLKPANVALTEGGLVKILDFGLARQHTIDEILPAASGRPRPGRGTTSASRLGTIAYMAPEQFVTPRTSERSDVFAFGIILYEMVVGAHPFMPESDMLPFMRADALPGSVAKAIQYVDPPRPRERRPDLPPELDALVVRALDKQPSNRFDSVAEIREALRTLVKTLDVDAAVVPWAEPSGAPPSGAEAEKKTGFFSVLVERLLGSEAGDVPENSVVVLPFANLGETDETPFYGLALAEAVATRLTAIPSLVVRPSRSAIATASATADAAEVGRRLLVTHVLTGTYLRSENGFDLTWQLLDARTNVVRTGGTISVASLDLVAIQNDICDDVFASLRGTGHLARGAGATDEASLPSDVWEDYLQARALLSTFVLRSSSADDLERARNDFRFVISRAPGFAAAHSGLGIAFLEYARKGLGGLSSVIEAQRSFDRALKLDPELVEANLYRAYTFLWRGEKESARHSVQHLLATASNNFDVRVVAAAILRLDGVYEGALRELGTALRLNPAGAAVVYNDRARIYHYQGQLDLATQEIGKGLTIEPRQPLLRLSLGYLYFRRGEIAKAIETLEAVLQDDANLRIAWPTLAISYAAAGERELSASMITDEVLDSADADGEMAYRVATYFATTGESAEAMHWLRKAIYLGNENYPWFSRNPAWERLYGDEYFKKTMADLAKRHRENVRRWKRGPSPDATAEAE